MSAPEVDPGERQIFVPALAGFPASLRELMGVLPVCDVNASLVAALTEGPAPRHLVAGLFAVDPFLDTREMAARLRRAGLSAVANYPTIQAFDGATGEGLSAVGYHARAELLRLTEFAALGFEALAYVASADAAEEALGLGLPCLVLHPGPGSALSEGVRKRIAAMASAAGAAVLQHAPAAGPHPDRP